MSTVIKNNYLNRLPSMRQFIKLLEERDEIESIITHGYRYRVVTFHSMMCRLVGLDHQTRLHFIQEFDLTNINLVADALMEAVRYEIYGMEFDITAYVSRLKIEYRDKLKYEPTEFELPIP